jgi:hypothetical protein
MNRPTILFVSHKPSLCGVYQFGFRIANVLKHSTLYNFVYIECESKDEYLQAERTYQPIARIINYHPVTLPWITGERIYPTIGIAHEGCQASIDRYTNSLFDFHIAPDPTLILNNKLIFKTGRLVDKYSNKYPIPTIPTIGTFGFATNGKGFDRIIHEVEKSFNHAIIKFNLPPSTFADPNGVANHMTVDRCKNLIKKPGITLEAGFDHLDDMQLLDFLAQNSINVFLYDNMSGRGISSAIDYALAVNRPIAITQSSMFRHISMPNIEIEISTLSEILNRGPGILNQFKDKWTSDNLIHEYEMIITKIINDG